MTRSVKISGSELVNTVAIGDRITARTSQRAGRDSGRMRGFSPSTTTTITKADRLGNVSLSSAGISGKSNAAGGGGNSR